MDAPRLEPRRLGRTDLRVTPIGFGAFKIGRNAGIKYARGYELPSDSESGRLLLSIVDDLGINYIDTAPAYGVSEERVGRVLGARKDVVFSTKVGETFFEGRSSYDFSAAAVRDSVARSRKRLRRDVIDLVFVHSDGDDARILEQTDVVAALLDAREAGDATAIGFSGKTVAGATAALSWADAIMVEYHMSDQSHAGVIEEAAARGVGVIVKKGLASGALPASHAIPFILRNRNVCSMVIGGLSLEHMRDNVAVATA